MTTTLATAPDFARLYELMAQVRALAPWEWMEEIDLFGVQDPDTRELGFVSIMGMAGEHFAVAVYRGLLGLDGFWRWQENAPFFGLEEIIKIPQLQASFEDREILQKRDRDIIKSLGLKFRGRNAWPMFRAYHRGFAPWFVEPAEARFLAHALEQVLDVAPRYRENPDMLDLGDGDTYLVRVAEPGDDGLVWRDTTMKLESAPPINIEFDVPVDLLDEVKQLPEARNVVEMDFFMSPATVGGRDERPYFPYILMTVEKKQGLVLGIEMLAPLPTLESMWEQVATTAIEQLAKLGVRPQVHVLENTILYGALVAYSGELGLKVKPVADLPALEEARASMEAFLGAF